MRPTSRFGRWLSRGFSFSSLEYHRFLTKPYHFVPNHIVICLSTVFCMNFEHEKIFCTNIGRRDRYVPIYFVFRYWEPFASQHKVLRSWLWKTFQYGGVWNEIRGRRGVQRVSHKCVEDEYCLLAENKEWNVTMFQCRIWQHTTPAGSAVATD
jgi:hypothetical protein